MTAAMEKERAAFETRFEGRFDFTRDRDGTYFSRNAQIGLDCWVARASISPQVPVEAINAAIEALTEKLRPLRHYIMQTGSVEGYAHARQQEQQLQEQIESLRALLPGGEK